jgi:hypothetical protein
MAIGALNAGPGGVTGCVLSLEQAKATLVAIASEMAAIRFEPARADIHDSSVRADPSSARIRARGVGARRQSSGVGRVYDTMTSGTGEHLRKHAIRGLNAFRSLGTTSSGAENGSRGLPNSNNSLAISFQADPSLQRIFRTARLYHDRFTPPSGAAL